MYCSHFGLHRPPFNNTPDPAFYFGTPEHEEALATLEYATDQRKGFVLITGEVGAGKTLIGRMFLRRIESRATSAVITHTQLSGRQLLAALCAEFELHGPSDASNLQLADRLQTFLLEQYAQDRLAVVLLDEAQNLPDESFEALRMLGNLEADDAKLIQICILGQPELRWRFEEPAMRQLNQRLFRRFHLGALTRAQAEQYIRHRLRTAGWAGEELFTPPAIDRVFAESRGMPRLINRICDNALLTAYGRGARNVDADIIEEVAASHAAVTGAAAAPEPSSGGAVPADPARDELHGTVRPWLDAGRSLAGYRNRVQAAVDDLAGQCDAVQDRLEELNVQLTESDRDIRALVQKAAEGLADLNSHVKELESTCSSAAEIDRVREECSAGTTEMLRRIGEQAEGLEKLRQECAQAMETAEAHRQTDLENSACRLQTQVDALRRLGDEVTTRQSGLQERIDSLTGQIAHNGGKVEALRSQIAAQKAEMEALIGQVAARLDGLGRKAGALSEGGASRRELEQVRAEQSVAISRLEGQHERAVTSLQRDVAQHENTVQDLNRQVGERMSAVEAALGSLQDASVSARDLETLRTEQSAALTEIARRVGAESQALAQLQDALNRATEVQTARQQTANAELSRQILAQVRRTRDLRHRLARMQSAIEGRLEGLGRELAVLRTEMATRQDLEQSRADRTACMEGMKQEHTRAVADIRQDLQQVRDEQSAVVENLTNEQARVVADLRDGLARTENVVEDLGRTISEQMLTLEQALGSLRDAAAQGVDLENLRARQAEALAEMERRLNEETDALVLLRQTLDARAGALAGDQVATKEQLLRRMLAQARRVRHLRGGLAHLRVVIEGRLDGLGRELAVLREEMATRQDLELARAEHSAALDDLKDRHERAVADIQDGLALHESMLQDLNRQARERLAGFEQALDSLRETSASGRELENLRTEQAVVLAEISRRLTIESDGLAALKGDLDQRSGRLSDDQQSKTQELSQRILTQSRWVRELRKRLSDAQSAMQAQFNVLAGDVRENRQMLAGLEAALSERESEIRALDAQMTERFDQARRALEAQQEQSATREDLERLRADQAGAFGEIERRLTREAGKLRQFREAVERQSACSSEEQRAALTELNERLETQSRQVQELRDRLLEAQRSVEARLEEMGRTFAGRDELESLRAESQGESARMREQLERQREVMEGLIEGVVQRCRAVQEELDALASSKAESGDVVALRARQEQAAAELLERLDRQREAVRARFEEVFSHWRQTDNELSRLASAAAPAEDLAALRQQQEQDTRQTLEALAAQRGELESLLVDVARRCDTFAVRLALLPEDFEAIRQEHAEQIRSVCARMDTGQSRVDEALREVNERCRQTQEQIEVLAARAASTQDVEAVREIHARDLSAVLQRLDKADSDHQQEIGQINRRWDELAQGVCSVAATAAPAASFAALEEAINENLSEMRSRLEAAHLRHQEDLRSMVWTVQQLAARLAAVETADRPAPVKIELTPDAGRDLAELTEQARQEREELARLAERLEVARREMDQTAGRVHGSLEEWRAGAAGIEEKAGHLRGSARAAGELLKGMQRAQRLLDGKMNSHRWQSELMRGEALAGRLERAIMQAGEVCGRLHASLRDFEHCRDEVDAWTTQCAEARQLVGALSKLLKAGRQAGASLESELDNRKRMLAAMARNTAGLVEVIDAARRAPAPAGPRQRTTRAAQGVPDSRLDWAGPLETAERLSTGAATL